MQLNSCVRGKRMIYCILLQEKLGCSFKNCYHTFQSQELLNNHISRKHAKKPPIKVKDEKGGIIDNSKVVVCDLCGKVFTSRQISDHRLRKVSNEIYLPVFYI